METSAESWNGPERTPPDHGTLPGAASVPDQGPGIGFLRRLLGGQDEREDDCCRDEFGNALMPESYAKLSPEELKTLDAKVLRKVDLRIMPITFFLFFVNFLDRTNISSAAVANKESGHSMIQTLGLTMDQYNWAASIFFFGYILFEVPSNLILKWASPSRWIARICISWGIVATCMAAVNSYGGLLACRFFLGVMEAGLSPGVIMYLTFWYKRSERGLRIAGFYLAGPFSSIFGGLIAAGIVQLDTKGGLFGWQWLYLLEGVPSILMGVITWFMLPDYPRTSEWLSKDERQYMEHRLVGHAASNSRGKTWVASEAKALMVNPLSYLFPCAGFFAAGFLYGLAFYAPIVITSLGFSSTGAIAMGAPLGITGIVSLLAFSYSSDHFKERYWHVMVMTLFPVTAYSVLATAPADAFKLKLGMLFLCQIGTTSITAISMTWRTDTTYGTTYSALATSTLLSISNIGGAVAPQVFSASDAPLFRRAFSIMATFAGLTMVFATFVYLVERFAPQYCGPAGSLHFSRSDGGSVLEEGEPKVQLDDVGNVQAAVAIAPAVYEAKRAPPQNAM